EAPTKSKSVQFPVNPVNVVQEGEGEIKPRKGNKAPVDPEVVLSREGDEAEGTSAGAAVDLAENDEDEGEVVSPGEVIMRDRMLVGVGYHHEEPLPFFDEAQQRRNPCQRMERLKEYIVVLRQGRVELYQDWRLPLQEHFKNQKRLAFIIPLQPGRTSITIFNSTDMTLCLTTSAGRLHDDLEHMFQSSRSTTIKHRLSHSKQVQWLRRRRQGTHVFILKIPERSRSLDWFWECWRELSGELPSWLDINVSELSMSIRLHLPQDEDEVGGKHMTKQFSQVNTVNTCFEMIKEVIDVEDLERQRSVYGRENVDLRLCWKSPSGELDWVAYDDTVEGKSRNWALLAGVSRCQNERTPGTLELRPAGHRPRFLRLEDGTSLIEPPGIEGYLIRHKSPTSPREHVYLSTHEGNIYTSTMKNAHPPLTPGKESHTPRDLFPEVFDTFQHEESERMSFFLQHSVGSVDLRSIEEVELLPVTWGRGPGGRSARSFELALSNETVKFEAHTTQSAEEWVQGLKRLVEYWKRRHRVDARQRMDALEVTASHDPFAGTELGKGSDVILTDIWDWCTLKGCTPVCQAGRLFVKRGPYRKFRHRYIVLSGGCIITFKIKSSQPFQHRKSRWPLFGAYVYSGMLAVDELHVAQDQDAFTTRHRVYQDGLQSCDGTEDTTFCVRFLLPENGWGKRHPWEEGGIIQPPQLSEKPPALLIFRARSKLERDRWVWAINAEMERQSRSHVEMGKTLRNFGQVPVR
ncbi:hypothetical protein TREMEDRAFT_25253, partial [Tremella mesenterica DSM 1558]|uniref:uncharacterized protein n=1 Tax=Tremella mesenterica (strain ATCC 24925 / CBS 8224 / DSM 1558 / NBRC 9311 / NRRL Y-6157 / RJB 2259-6 / UBC 559-6) TaxID=578456 RepID=UPI0003F4A602